MTEPHGQRFALHEGELVGSVVAGDGEMILRRAEVLADGENVDADAGQIAVDGEELVHFFAETDHDSRFCNSVGIDFFGELEEAESALVTGSGADDAVEAWNRFGIVVQDFRARFDDEADGFRVALEVGDEDFDLAPRRLAADL